MKKRIMSLVLAVMMILTVLPAASVYADADETDTPKLYFCYAQNSGDGWTLREDMQPELNCIPGYDHIGGFYYGSEDSAKLVNVKDLGFPDYLTVGGDDRLELPDNCVRIHVSGFAPANGKNVITYTQGDITATFPVNTMLPELGFYTEPAASEAAYIYEDHPFTVTADDRTVYLCVRDSGMEIIEITQWYNAEAALFTVTSGTDASYLTFTLKGGANVPSGNIGVEVKFSMSHNDETRTNTNSAWLSLKSGVPSLMARDLIWSETGWTLDENGEFRTSISFSSGDFYPTAFFYGTEAENTRVDLSDLSFTGVIRGSEEDGAVRLEATAYEGNGAVTYTKDGVSASLPVTVTPPHFGIYSSSTASAETYLNGEVSVGGESDVFYIVAAEEYFKGFEVTEIWFDGPSGIVDAVANFGITYSEDGSYATLTPNADNLPPAGSYRVELRGNGGNNFNYTFEFDLVRTDLAELTTPSDLTWNTEYRYNYVFDDDGENYTITEEAQTRMGVMSFATDKTTQNRFAIELYSAEDGYTTPVRNPDWTFGDQLKVTHFSVTSFIYGDLPDGTYKFRVRALGDGTEYRDSEWSELSEAWTYTSPDQSLQAPDAKDFDWVKDAGQYAASWKGTGEDGVGYYQIEWYIEDGQEEMRSGGDNFDIRVEDSADGVFTERLPDYLLEENGNNNIFFRVRAIPSDITAYCASEYSDYSEAFDVNKVTVSVNDKLDEIDKNAEPSAIIEQVQNSFENDTEDLRTAMAADLDGTGGPSSGTLDRVAELESAVSDAVGSNVEVAADAPQKIKDIENGITMIGAKLNVDTASEETPSVKLVISEADEGSIIDTQKHNAIQFSMKLSGAVDRDNDGANGQQLIVPIVIDMPIPAGINPGFLVILHKLSDGTIEQIRPYIYEDNDCCYARFIVSSFSDFALVEYSFGFETDALTKYTDSEPFTLAASGNAEGSTVRYESSDPEVASVDENGLVTVHKAGTTTITATATAVGVFPEVSASCVLTVKTAQSGSSGTQPDTKPDTKPDDDDKFSFSDVLSDAFYADAVAWAVENGITKGTGDGTTFSPDDLCTRAQMAVFLWRAAGEPEPKSAGSFSDVAEDTYYAKAVAWAVENGITKGTGDGTTFSPDDFCTRAQMVTFLSRLADGKTSGSSVTFTDVMSGAYYADAVIWAVENGITKGTGDGTTFSPDDLCTRAQMVTFLYRYFAM